MFHRTVRLATWCAFLAGFYVLGIASGIGVHTIDSAHLLHPPAMSMEYQKGYADGLVTTAATSPSQIRSICDFYLRAWISIEHRDTLTGSQNALVDYLDGCIDGLESRK